MKLFCHKNPSLPQNSIDPEERQNQLNQAQLDYIWDMTKPNLAGIPMAQSVPVLHNYPSLKWAIKVLEITLKLFDNILAAPLPNGEKSEVEPKKQSDCILLNLANILALVAKIFALLLKKILKSLLCSQSQKNTWSEHKSFILAFGKAVLLPLVSKQKVLANLGSLHNQFSRYLLNSGLDGFKYLFKTTPLPITADTLFDDVAFARFRLAGPNPMLLQGIDALPRNFKVAGDAYKSVMSGDTLEQALADKRLYIVDYQELAPLATAPGSKLDDTVTTYVCTPIALFAVSKDKLSFKPVAIQIAKNIYYATTDINDPTYWDWQTAKTLVQNADANYHELLVHLARTHLLTEAFAVATPRCLAKNHPLFVLLNPHFEGSLFINESAEQHLVNPGGKVDEIFSATIGADQATAGGDRLNYNFYDAMLPNNLSLRGVDNPDFLPDYPYRDDGLLIWNAIHNWVSAYCDIYYVTDADVIADTELSVWCVELMNEGKVKGFTAIQTKPQLVDVLTMIIYTASAQHAAVNFPQSNLMAYLPAFPGSVVDTEPPTNSTSQQWFNRFPPLQVGQTQLELFYLLGSVYYSKLGEYRSNRFPYCSVMTDKRVKQPLAEFKAELKHIEYTIHRLNQKRKPYTFLLPSNIPASTNI